MKRALLFAGLVGACACKLLATPATLDALLASPELWATRADDFIEANGALGFAWTSAAKEEARSDQGGLTLLGLPVYEASARFDAGQLKGLTFQLFTRGDAGDLPKEKFDALLKQSADAISASLGKKFTPQGQETASAVQAYALAWPTEQTKYLLEYSFTKEVKTRHIPYRAEFVRLQVLPAEKQQSLVASALAAKPPEHFSGKAHVVKDANGDVRIDGIPMVDQGEKRYCVVATAERVLRYYGSHADEHELAQIANTSTENGTSVTALVTSLKKVGAKLRVKVREIEKFDARTFEAMVRDYNRAARHDGGEAIELNNRSIDVEEIYRQMNGAIFRTARNANRSDAERFNREIQASIDAGIPLLWSVMLGVLPQPHEPKELGGHMRLIVGYNRTANQIIYSDSWGAGHEFKSLPLADAWTITTALDSVEAF